MNLREEAVLECADTPISSNQIIDVLVLAKYAPAFVIIADGRQERAMNQPRIARCVSASPAE